MNSKESTLAAYVNYIISNLILVNDWIDKFGVGDDYRIKEEVEQISKSVNDILDRMSELGIDTPNISNKDFDIKKHIRDFKIKRLLQNEGN
jgi:hypothetical protein